MDSNNMELQAEMPLDHGSEHRPTSPDVDGLDVPKDEGKFFEAN